MGLIKCVIIIFIIVIVIALLWKWYDNRHKIDYVHPEHFETDEPKNELETYYDLPSKDISDISLNNLECHPRCCRQQEIAYDGLDADGIKQSIALNTINSDSNITSNYTCQSNKYGVGCVCFTPKAYDNIINRSQKSDV